MAHEDSRTVIKEDKPSNENKLISAMTLLDKKKFPEMAAGIVDSTNGVKGEATETLPR